MITRRFTSLLLLTTALSAPALAHGATAADAGSAPSASSAPNAAAAPAQTARPPQEETEVSLPGVSEITVVGRRNVTQANTQVVSVLSTNEIARTGEGNIAGALQRVPGLSLVGSGYVYVRGLGDRYSLALLNGSPLPSPEPLKRVVPLDLFPSNIVSSSLVQKSYSPNFPGEFGGGVINLTTRAIPQEGFVTISGSVGGDTFTTLNRGYTYYGSKSDWSGFDNGERDVPPALAAFIASGERISTGKVDTGAIASQLVTARNAVVQEDHHIPANWSGSLSAGKSFEVGSMNLGLIGSGSFSNKFTTRDAINQTSLQGNLETLESNFQRVTTDQRIVANGLFGAALDFGENRIRWTNVFIHDTIKNTRLGLGQRHGTTVDYLRQNTAWYERQLIDTQVVGEFKPTENLSVDVRGSYANSKRKAPGELSIEYARTNVAADPFGQYFVNRLNNGNAGDATITYSDLDEDLWSGGVDATYAVSPNFSATVGYAYSDTSRESTRRDFQFQAPSTFPGGVDMLRPDLLLAPSIIETFGITLVETNEGNPAFLAKLRNHAGYLKLDGKLFDDALTYDAGVRYETAKQEVSPIQVFNTPGASLAATNLDNDYWLPAATLTWQLQPSQQLRLSASKTIARPQFRELIYQFYFDPDSNRTFRGNPLLTDSTLKNAEARYEWYFGGDQHFAVAGFYKDIKRPIETYVVGETFTTSFANAPKANLYGVEFEAQKNFELSDWGGVWSNRRFVAIANYTYSKSKLKVGDGDSVAVFAATSTKATDYFRDGAPLTGQSDHVVNLELGFEASGRLSQQTLLFNYASKRVTSRGLANTGQPDVTEYPGLRIDFVAREGFEVFGREIELKFEARNLTGQKYQEYQKAGSTRVDVNTYDLGRVFTVSAQARF